MTTLTSPDVTTLGSKSFSASVPMTRLIQMETRKLGDTRAARWLMGIVLVGMLLAAAGLPFIAKAQASATVTNHQPTDWMGAVSLVQLPTLLVPVIVILLVTSEWSQRGALTTFLLEPRRLRVVAAKAIAAVELTIVISALMWALTALAGLITNATMHLGVDWTGTWKQIVGLVALNLLTTAIAFGFALLLMNSPAAIVSYLLIPTLLPLLVFIPGAARVLDWVSVWNNMNRLLLNDWASHGVLKLVVSSTIWILVPLVIGLVRHQRVEVK